MKYLLSKILEWVFWLTIPFILLIRSSVFIHDYFELNAWLAIALSVFFSAFLVLMFFSFVHDQITGRIGNLRGRFLLSICLVVAFVINGIFFMSGDNMKTAEVASEINEVHPVLRLAVSTLAYLDEDLIITDGNRKPEDYAKMGLKTKKRSLHYKQSDGYAHALDLRTNDRTEWRNFLLQNYFRLMGFNTLRHVGTADHLHISIQSHDNPNAI